MQMPISELDADGAIQAFYDEFPGLSGLHIIHAPSQESFYGHNASVTALGFRIKGAFLPKTRELHLPLANFRDLGELRQSLQHEALGHYGLLTFTNAEKRALLSLIILARDAPSMQRDWDHVERAYAEQSDLMKAEEVYCLAAERVACDVSEPSNADLNFARVWDEIVVKRTRRCEREDLQIIANFVASGLRNGTRAQTIFPANDQAQFDE